MPITQYINTKDGKEDFSINIPKDYEDYRDGDGDSREKIISALELVLKNVRKAHGYELDISGVERQGNLLDGFSIPDNFLLMFDEGQDYNNPDESILGFENLVIDVSIVGIVTDDRNNPTYNLDTKLKKLLSQVIKALELNNTLTGLVCEIEYGRDRLSGQFLYPQAAFVLPIKIEYQIESFLQV